MPHDTSSHKDLKAKVLHELKLFWIIALYLLLLMGSFDIYRRLILAEYGVAYWSYGFKAVEALVVAKVILLGEAMGLGRRYERRPLIISVMAKSVVFAIFIVLFSILEHIVEALFHKAGWSEAVHSVVARGTDEMAARVLVLVVALVPFFAFLELSRVLGPGRLSALFFGHALANEPALPD